MEKTLVLIKPDGVKRKLIGKIIDRYEQKGLTISNMKMTKASRSTLEKHYEDLKDKDFFEDLINYMTSGPLIAMIIEGSNVISSVRKMHGNTNPIDAEMGTIRGDFGNSKTENLVHASDSKSHALKEISIWFNNL
ncbi:nucleoside-diphosphate kinase [Clostridium oceanicum]|uniref:Nucleoside diphosphate kinase n=1 Tax=Clostridium oceanicum TaxID=1543 RepID=A0ABN1JJ51_9CLOT